QKPRKLAHGKEILRTENFTLIYLGSGNFHYSYATRKKLIYGHIDLKKNHFKIIPLLALGFFLGLYLSFTSNPNADIENNGKNGDGIGLDERDVRAKNADDKYLQETEEQKKALVRTGNTASLRLKTYYAKEGESVIEIAARFRVS